MVAAAAARRIASSGGLTSLSHGLTKQLSATKEGAGNLVFSPLSIHSALSLVAAGSRGRTLDEFLAILGGTSREELAENVLGVVDLAFPAPSPQPPTGGGPRVLFASGLWHDAARTLKPAYRDAGAAYFRAVARAVDFRTQHEEARKEINSWVASTTNNLIDYILEKGAVDASTRIVVTNAIYFKGAWKTPFDKARTRNDVFRCLDGSTVDAEFMSSNKDQFVAAHDGFKLLRMPYAAAVQDHDASESDTEPPQYSMLVVLPDAHDALWSLEEKIRSIPDFLLDHLPREPVKVGRFLLPKFKLSFYGELSETLQNRGIKDMFSWTNADLQDMLMELGCCHGAVEPLWLTHVLHRAVIEVDEEGAEAAAVTVCVTRGSCLPPQDPPPRVDFVADHPFAFFVVEEVSGAIVFAGHVLDPTEQAAF